MLLSQRFQAKLPISEYFQTTMNTALTAMKIKAQDLHHSQKVLTEFDNLREQLLVLFALDKYVMEKQDEHAGVKEQSGELEALRQIYEIVYTC